MIDAPGREQIILRKGGIHEGRGGFQVDQPEFWLFPTLFHQQGACHRRRVERWAKSPMNFRLRTPCARVLRHRGRLAQTRKRRGRPAPRRPAHLEGESRPRTISWGLEQGIRLPYAHRPPQPVDLPMLKEYGGANRGSTSTRRPPPKATPPSSTISHSRLNSTPSAKRSTKNGGTSRRVRSGDHCHCTSDSGNQQQQEYRPGLGQAGPDEAVGEVVVIPDPDRLAKPAPDEDHRDEVGQRNEKHQQRRGTEPLRGLAAE